MRVVIDASAALYQAASRDGFDALSRHTLVAPALLWSEATSVLNEMRRRGEISDELVTLALDRLLTSSIERRSGRHLYRNAVEVARNLGWAKTYDAEYVALARTLGLPLLTRDARLRRRAAPVVQVVAPDDLVGRP